MLLLIHIAVPLATIEQVQGVVESCCVQTGDMLIGRRNYDDVGEVLLVVRLIQNHYLTKHTLILNDALQEGVILSFQPETTNLVSVHCTAPANIRDLMRGVPLLPNESWFPALCDPQMAYFCTRRNLVGPLQMAWFSQQGLEYCYS